MNQKTKITHDEAVGAAIVFARNLRGVTRNSLANALGVSERTLGSIERGSRTAKRGELIAIATILNVPLPWFTTLEALPETVEMGPFNHLPRYMTHNAA